MKRILKIVFAVLFALLIALILVPIFFKPELIKSLKAQINENLNAKVDFKDVDISLLRSLPKLTIDIEDLKISGINQFKDQNLFSAKDISVTTDIKSLFNSAEGITLYSIVIDNGNVDVVVNKAGQANYDISKPQETSEQEDSFFGSIENYSINNSGINYIDQTTNMILNLQEVNHSGKGKFKDVLFDLFTTTLVNKASLTYNGIPYLKNAKLSGDINLSIDASNQKYTFKQNNIKINDLDLSFLGNIQLLADAINFDLNINAPNNKVSSIISIIPNLYTEDFGSIISKGSSTLKGVIKGDYNGDTNTFPLLNLNLMLDDGYIKYPNLKLPIEDINIDAQVVANDKHWNDLTLDVKHSNFELNKNKVAGQLRLKNILNNTLIDGRVDGMINLKDFADALPMDDIKLKSGLLDLDFELVANKNDIINNSYDKITFEGTGSVTDLDINYSDKLNINSKNISSEFSPKTIKLKTNNIDIGKTDVHGEIIITDPLLMITDSIVPPSNVQLKSRSLNLTQLQSVFMDSENDESVAKSNMQIPPFDIKYSTDEVIYENYDIKNVNGQVKSNRKEISIVKSDLKLDNATIDIRGDFTNVENYLNKDDILNGKIFFESKKINANKYIESEVDADSESALIKVPKNIDLEIYPTIDVLEYGSYVFKDMTGKIDVSDGIAMLENGQTKLFNGKVKFDGKYDTSGDGNPLFDFKYNMDELEFTKMFQNSKSFKALAPIAGFIEGIFNSTLVISGPLKDDMMPDLSKINASGFIETVQGKVKGFKPLEQLANTLKVSEISNLDIKDSRNWFDIKDGIVSIKPHDYTLGDMSFTIGGNHSLDQVIDYTIKAKIPRDKLKNANLGSVLEKGMSTLEQAATSRGVDLNLGENIFLDIYLTGSLTKPKIKIIPVGSGGKTLKEVVKDKVNKEIDVLKDTITQELEKKTEEIKDTISKVVQEKVDTLTAKVEEKVQEKTDELYDKVKDELKEKVDSSILGSAKDSLESKLGDKVGDVLGDTGKSEIDSLKEKLNGWGLFKKKKKK